MTNKEVHTGRCRVWWRGLFKRTPSEKKKHASPVHQGRHRKA